MDSIDVGIGHYQMLYNQLLSVDAQLIGSTGMAQTEFAVEKTRILNRMVDLCVLHGLSEAACQWDALRNLHLHEFPNAIPDTTLNHDARIAAVPPTIPLNDVDRNVPSTRVRNESRVSTITHRESMRGNRLANVAPKTPDQVNDKKVAEKSGQVDRAYVQLETMTTPHGDDTKDYPRHNTFLITITECKPNSGGGSRTQPLSVEEKRRDGTLVVLRSMRDSPMLEDGTLRNALFATLQKLNAYDHENTETKYDMLLSKHRFHVASSPFDVAVAQDWASYYQLVFGQEKVRVRPNKKHRISTTSEMKDETTAKALKPVPDVVTTNTAHTVAFQPAHPQTALPIAVNDPVRQPFLNTGMTPPFMFPLPPAPYLPSQSRFFGGNTHALALPTIINKDKGLL